MVENTALHQQLRLLIERDLNIEVPSDETDLIGSNLLDSLGFVELIASIEQQFGVRILLDTLELDHFRSVNSMVSLIETLAPQA